MKKIIGLVITCLILLTSCNTGNLSSDKTGESLNAVVEIKDRMFISQTNDIYLNTEDYVGRTIKYEGVFDIYQPEPNGKAYNLVVRYGPGCCGNDGTVGFEVAWDGDYPEQNDWVEVMGEPAFYEEDGAKYLYLNLSSLTVLAERGLENVTQ